VSEISRQSRNRGRALIATVAWIFIAAGAVGLAYHAGEFNPQRPLEPELLAGVLVRLLAVIGGVFLLRGQNWARWLLIVWLAYHVVLSAFHSPAELVFHGILLALFSWILFRTDASPYFRREAGSHP